MEITNIDNTAMDELQQCMEYSELYRGMEACILIVLLMLRNEMTLTLD